jgi:hypothetical protein
MKEIPRNLPEGSLERTARDLSPQERVAAYELTRDYALGGNRLPEQYVRELPSDVIARHELPHDRVQVVAEIVPPLQVGDTVQPPGTSIVTLDLISNGDSFGSAERIVVFEPDKAFRAGGDPSVDVSEIGAVRMQPLGEEVTVQEAPSLSLEETRRIINALQDAGGGDTQVG